MATRNASIVLLDDDGVRAVMTGSWLVQMGWPEVYVLDGGLAGRSLVRGTATPAIPEVEAAQVATIPAAELKVLLDNGDAVLVDLAPSIAYEQGHIPGAWFAVRARLPQSLERVPKRRMLVLTSPDGVLARLATAELGDCGFADVRVLDCGTAAWRAARLPLSTGREQMAYRRLRSGGSRRAGRRSMIVFCRRRISSGAALPRAMARSSAGVICRSPQPVRNASWSAASVSSSKNRSRRCAIWRHAASRS